MNLKSRFKTKYFVTIIMIVLFLVITYKNTELGKPLAKGFMWEATKGGQTITLVGTSHTIPERYKGISKKLNKKIKEADVLCVEVDLNDSKNLDKVIKARYLPEGETIENYLSKAEVNKLMSILKPQFNNLFTAEKVKRYNALPLHTLVDQMYVEDRYRTESLDSMLMWEANRKGISIIGLETVQDDIQILSQYNTWDTLKEKINNFYEDKEEIEKSENVDATEAYIKSDAKRMEEIMKNFKDQESEQYETLVKDRNKKMADKIENITNEGKKYVVAVGCGHFFGEGNLISYLEEKGYQMKRIN